MSWVACVHFYLHFASAADAAIAKQELENFIYQEKHLERFLRVEHMEGIAMEIQNFSKQKFRQNLQGSWQEENRDVSHYINEMIDGKIESENGEWLLDYPIQVIRQLRAIAQIITKKT